MKPRSAVPQLVPIITKYVPGGIRIHDLKLTVLTILTIANI